MTASNQSNSDTLLRSNIHQQLMPDDLMLEAFGKLTPSRDERTRYFFDLWCDSRDNRMSIRHRDRKREFIKFCEQFGLRLLWDFQIKGQEVRFCQASDLAMIKIGWEKSSG